ncbi:MAG: ribosome-associated translation inhibitor RaiA [Planctomycetota bacterium]|jgi:ribosome-associated translation inhibitor RaiA
MQILIHHPNLKSNEEAIHESVQQTLGRFDDRVTRIDVFIKDINGDKGGEDKHCSIEAHPRGLDPMAATHQAESISAAVSGAAEKLRTQMTRQFDKLADH